MMTIWMLIRRGCKPQILSLKRCEVWRVLLHSEHRMNQSEIREDTERTMAEPDVTLPHLIGGPVNYIPKKSVMDAFNKTSVYDKEPEIGFSTSARPPLNPPTAGPGPGAYVIKSTIHKSIESNMKSPCEFTLRGREKFGDPNERALSKACANEPGPGNYDLIDKFLGGSTARKCVFSKGLTPRERVAMGPGPGSYKPIESLGHQALSTKKDSVSSAFPLAPRSSIVPVGISTVGPGEYAGAHTAACEAQIDSRKATAGSIKFGTGYKKGSTGRKLDLSEPTPGPGSYVLPGGVSTRARGTPYRNSPAAMLSGRNKFGSPF